MAVKKKPSFKGGKITKLSPLGKPEDMTLQQWQVALRKEFGGKQNFRLKNSGQEPIFSEFILTNPQTSGDYRVAIRGANCGDNFCSCRDFAVNTLGTCKHIEFTLQKLRAKRGGAKSLAQGFQPAYSEIYVRYGLKREVVFKSGTQCLFLLTQFSQALQGGSAKASSPGGPLSPGLKIETDKVTGQRHLQWSLPPKETLEKFFNVLNQLIQKM